MKYHIVTFGCAANIADSERIAKYYEEQGYAVAKKLEDADVCVVVTCMIRQSAEDRVCGLAQKIEKLRLKKKIQFIVSGCMTGLITRDTTGKLERMFHKRIPAVDAFIPIEEIGVEGRQKRTSRTQALIPISNGCNNFCTYCVVPYARGREVSRAYTTIIQECREAIAEGAVDITLVGQNVNSYGSDIVSASTKDGEDFELEGKKVTPVLVNHLGKMRIPTLFPFLLEAVATLSGVRTVDFISSNPWDFSDELIAVIQNNPTVSRHIHLPVQSGDDEVLQSMNRWYTTAEYESLVKKIRGKIPDMTFSTDIIVGFPGETEKQFENTVSFCERVGFTKAYVAMYSDRPKTKAHESLIDDVTKKEKRRRWIVLEELINKTNLRKGTYTLTQKNQKIK